MAEKTVFNFKTGEATVEQFTPEPYVPPQPTQEQIDARRQQAYQVEADPLFFKWQRGQATEQEWLDKIAEIKQRYPDAQENT